MLVYNFQIYEWPMSLLRKIEPWCRNFLWSSSFDKRGVPLVSWRRCICEHIMDIFSFHDPGAGDLLVWAPSSSGGFSAKDAYEFTRPKFAKVPWCKLIWKPFIEPWKSFLAWKVMHGRLLTEDFLQKRAWMAPENINHLFSECPFTCSIWSSMFIVFGLHFTSGPLAVILSSGLSAHFSPQLMDLWLLMFRTIVWLIWDLRNKLRFEEKVSTVSSNCRTIINHVPASSPLARGHILNKVHDLCIIRSIGVHYRPRPNSKIVEVTWHPPCFGFVKIKIDGACKRDSGKAGSGGVFRNYQGHVLGAFSANLDVPSGVHAEVLAVIKAIELAWLHAWHNIWIETDSLLVTKFFRSPHLVPWRLRVDWQNCLLRLQHMSFKISHIFREGNHDVDALANHGALGSGLTWWDTAPSFIFALLSAGLVGRA
ncbi:hypothetical protein PRUPE_4G283800 [Prunus persica]|uniref:Uncharacterized protein n=1 Tax=Prunus persica TaxID=3760 RepID=A0A251PVM7_PRUPE|nr:hypothetical protein PRUPE_4G283800 [Prunus persica]